MKRVFLAVILPCVLAAVPCWGAADPAIDSGPAVASATPAFKSQSVGQRVTVKLNDGSKVEGIVLREDAKVIFLALADEVLSLDRTKIDSIENQAGEAAPVTGVTKFKLYQTGAGVVKATSAFARELGPAIVVVRTPAGLGTGWFCHPDGYVVTNQHVVADEQSITITAFKREGDRFEKKTYKKVKLVALNEEIDLALLQIEEPLEMTIPQLYVGDSDKVSVGDHVFTIGNPLGLERSTSEGIISKTNRSMGGRLYIQTTAPIAPGNSGGPLFNERGEVIGMTNMGYLFVGGLNFAIPSRYIREFLDNVEAFAYDADNPNSGIKYMEPPVTAVDNSLKFTAAEFIKASQGVSCLTLADMNGDGVKEIVYVDNKKGEIGVIRRRRPDEPLKPPQSVDFEDINRLPESERFILTTCAVHNSISSLAVTDMNGDGRPDVVFNGDIDGLCVLEQQADGTFGAARKLARLDLADRHDALKVADLNGDGTDEIFALGKKEFYIVAKDGKYKAYPLNADYREAITCYELLDVNHDGRLDVVFFVANRFYAGRVLVQGTDGKFVDEEMIPSQLSGPVAMYKHAGLKEKSQTPFRFVTLDKGQNRVRELTLGETKLPERPGQIDVRGRAVPIDADAGAAPDVVIADFNGDGAQDILTVNRGGNEFVTMFFTGDTINVRRSPAPKKVEGMKLYTQPDGRAVLFSYSTEDQIFGASRVDANGVSFPRPINIAGQVQYLWLGKLSGDETVLLWVEKVGDSYFVRTTPAAALAVDVLGAPGSPSGEGSIDVKPATLRFAGEDGKAKEALPGKPDDLAFADFNGDGLPDLVVHWAFSGKESLYLGRADNTFDAIIVSQEFLKEQKGQPLLVADIDQDGHNEVLLVQPGFVRVLKVDQQRKLYVQRQFNWQFDQVQRLLLFTADPKKPRFIAVTPNLARVVEFDIAAGEFRQIGTVDLAGLDPAGLQVGDFNGDGAPDLLLKGKNALDILCQSRQRRALDDRIVFNARLEAFTYWNLYAADLTGDGEDEVLLFDSRKAMFEVYRAPAGKDLELLLRHRLFDKSIYQRGENDSYELPTEVEVGDVDGNGKADLIFILQDRVAIYLQDAAATADAAK